jgi:hypothetical protein
LRCSDNDPATIRFQTGEVPPCRTRRSRKDLPLRQVKIFPDEYARLRLQC